MGLSNEERIGGLHYAIDALVEIADHLKEKEKDYGYQYPKKLVSFLDQLWFAFLGKTRNSAHWLIGSSATSPVTWGSLSPWGVAINHHCRDVLDKEDDLDDLLKKSGRKNKFDAFDGFLDIPGLLNRPHREIYNIYSWSEQLVYYLRRYEDDLLDDMQILSKIVSDIQGECFTLFKKDDSYAKAYILSMLTKMIYGPLYPYDVEKWDPLVKHLNEDNLHHSLNHFMAPTGDLKTLAEIHVKMQRAEKNKKMTLMLRAEAMLELTGREYHYDRMFTKLETLLKGSVTRNDLRKLKGLFNKNKKEHEEYEGKSRNNGTTQENLLSIYGFSVK